VIAAPEPIGVDQDKERIAVYTNLFGFGTFDSAGTAGWGLQPAPGRTNQAAGALLAADSDSNNVVATNVWQFTLTDLNSGVKASPFAANYLPVTQGQWYISRLKFCDHAVGNADGVFLYSFTVPAAPNITSDISADIDVNTSPNTWSWLEAPVYAHAAQVGNTFLPQFQIKAGLTGTANNLVDIAEVQVIQATPKLLDGTRGGVRNFYQGGLLTSAAVSTYWGTQTYANSSQQPAFSYTADATIGSCLSANFAGAASAPNAYGFKWTAASGGAIYTPTVPVGKVAGVTAQLDVVSALANANELSQVLVAGYGSIAANASSAIDHLDAAAIVGVIPTGASTLATVGVQPYGYMQVQFGMRGDATGVVNFANVDYLIDTNDPNFGDEALFP